MKKARRKFMAAIMVLAMMMTMASGCGKSSSGSSAKSGAGSNASEVTYNTLESESWDPMRDSTSGGLIKHLFEGLMTWENGELALGCAESVTPSDDKLSYDIIIRDDAKWSDGQPVTAEDFKYSWLRQLNPENAAKYCSYLYWIKNGEEYNTGAAKEDEVGLEVAGDKELKVTLKAPCAYFEELLAGKVYLPVRSDVVEQSETWWSDPATCIGNGPYKLESYTANDSMVLVKNDNYREADKVYINKVTARFITDSQVELMAYQTGEIQVGIMPPTDSLKDLEQSGDLVSNPKLTCYWLVLNCQEDVVKDAKVRKALSMAIDRDKLVENVTKGGEIPAYDLIPPQVEDTSTGEAFNKDSSDYYSYNVEEAKKLLSEAGYPDGKGFPTLTYAISSGSNHAEIAQAIQSMWKENLGINVDIVEEELSVFISDRKAGKFNIARYTWEGSYADPDTWLSLYVSDSENNDSKYNSSKYDEIVKKAQQEIDPAKRFKLLHEADEVLVKEDMGVIPLFYPVNNYLVKSSIKNLGINPNGDIYWKGASVE